MSVPSDCSALERFLAETLPAETIVEIQKFFDRVLTQQRSARGIDCHCESLEEQIDRFISDCCELGPEFTTPRKELYEEFLLQGGRCSGAEFVWHLRQRFQAGRKGDNLCCVGVSIKKQLVDTFNGVASPVRPWSAP